LTGLLLRGLLGVLLLTVACSGRVSHNPGTALESTGTTHEALSCITEASLANLPQWSSTGSYAENDQVQDNGQAWTCRQSECPTEWEPGSPGTSAIWYASPVCGVQPWSGNSVAYEKNDIVTYGGQFYQCAQAHTSESDWTPPATLNVLWNSFNPGASAPGAVGDPTELTPIVNCVAQTGPGQYTAVFGYSNSTSSTIVAPIGSTNEFTEPAPPVAPAGRGQPIAFAPGENDGAFVVDFDGTALTWQLGDTSVTASSSSPACATTQGPNGPVVTIGGNTVLVHPDPTTILSGSILPTETVPTTGFAVGGLRGSFSVTGDGASTYQIPLWSPPGRMGIQPHLSLSYSSRASRGLAGYGWDVAGFGISRITRCQTTIAQDGDATPITFGLDQSLVATDDDAFCLDGTRLVRVSVNNGVQVYALQSDPFTQVVFDTNKQTFTVNHRDGSVFSYGSTPSSRLSGTLSVYAPAADGSGVAPPPPTLPPTVTYEWGLDTVTDATGNNTMSTTWDQDTVNLPVGTCQEMLPSQISYVGASRIVALQYDPDVNKTCRFFAGFGVASTQHLREIDVTGPTGSGIGRLRAYKMTYDVGPTTNRTRLRTVQECDGAGVCTPATALNYEPGSTVYQTVNFYPSPGWPNGVIGSSRAYSDINGDGKDDVVYVSQDIGHTNNCILNGRAINDLHYPISYFGAALSSGTQFGAPSTLSLPGEKACGKTAADTPSLPTVGPFPLMPYDGLSTFLQMGGLFSLNEGAGTIPPGLVQVATHSTTKTKLGWAPITPTATATSPAKPTWVVDDLDGDGRPDVVTVDGATAMSSNPRWRYALASQGFLNPPVIADVNGNALNSADPTDGIFQYTAPLDGTGKTAVLLRGASNVFGILGLPDFAPEYLVSATANPIDGHLTFQPTTLPVGFDWGQGQVTSGFYYLFIDLNADGNADAIQVPVGGGPPNGVAYNTGAGFGPIQPLQGVGTLTLPPATNFNNTGPNNAPTAGISVADVTGDGYSDIILTQLDSNGNPVGATVWSPDGSGAIRGPLTITDTTGMEIAEFSLESQDFDGDGQPDLAAGPYPSGIPGTTVYLHTGNKPDELTSIQDGYGKNIVVQYKSIGDPTVYTPDTGCTYPEHCTNKGLWVVSQYTVTTDAQFSGAQAAPTVNTFNYTYASGRSDVRGRGWLGFGTQTVYNPDTSTTTTTTFDNGGSKDEVAAATLAASANQPYSYPTAGLPVKTVTQTPIAEPSVLGGPLTYHVTTMATQYEVQSANGVSFARAQLTETTLEDDTALSPALPLVPLALYSDATTTYGYDSFNNVTARTTTFLSHETRSYSATFTQNTTGGKYLLSLPQTTIETSTVPGQAPVTRTHAYDPDPSTGLLKDETVQPNGDPTQQLVIQYDRNAFGQVTHMLSTAADPLQVQPAITREAWTTFDPTDSIFPVSTSNALGHTSRAVFHPGLGVPVFSQDPNGVPSQMQYDGFGRARSRSTAGRPTVTIDYVDGQLFFGQTSNISGLYTVSTSDSLNGSSFVTYDALSNEVMRGTKNHDGTYSYVQTVYNGVRSGQVYSVSRPFASTGTPIITTFQYDALGRQTTVTLPDGNTVRTFYNGLATTLVDARGYARTRVLDDRGRLVQVDEDSTLNRTSDPALANPPSNATVITTAYAYGPFDVLNSVSTRPRGGSAFTTTSSMHYDALGRRTDLIDADRGHAVTTFDAFSEPVTELDANGQTHILTRDAIGRTTVDYSTQDGTTTFQWDTAAHGVGKLAQATSADKIPMTYAYDSLSRGTETKWHINGQDFAVDKLFDGFGRVQTLQYPAVGGQRLSVTYGFDAVGQVSSVTGSDASAPLTWTATAWETDGQLNRELLNDGEQTIRTHHPARAWLTDIVTAGTSMGAIQEVQHLHYDYDEDGNLKGRTDASLGTTETFHHDFLDRIDTWTFASSTGTGAGWTTAYNIDDFGNIRSRTMTGPGAPPAQNYQQYGTRDGMGANPTAYGLHAVTQINGDGYGYDSKGNQLTAPGRTMTYTSFGLPRTAKVGGKTTRFQYDANHQRAFKKGRGASTVYVGGLYEERTDSSGNVTHVFFVPGAGRVVGQVEWTADSSGAVNGHNVVYLHDDRLGSIDALTGPSITGTTHLKYDPFGGRINPTNPTVAGAAPADVTDGFTDQQHDDEFGLIDFQGRVYDPSIARFVSPDPLTANSLSSQGFNRYTYANNSPLTFVDPTGFIQGDFQGCLAPSGVGSGGGPGVGPNGCGGNPSGDVTPDSWNETIPGQFYGPEPDSGCNYQCGNVETVFPVAPGTQDGATTPVTDSNGTVTVSVADSGNSNAQSGWGLIRDATLNTAFPTAFPTALVVGKYYYNQLNVKGKPYSAQYEAPLEDDTVGNQAVALAGGVAASGVRTTLVAAADLITADTVAAEGEGACAGGMCPCFVAGTAVDTDDGTKPIEAVALGDRVGPELAECAAPELAQWREVGLAMRVLNGDAPDDLEIHLLRPERWIAEHSATVGGSVAVRLDDLNVEGRALVTNIGATGHVASGRRCPVTGWVRHISHDVIELALEGAETLKVTRHHRLFSATQGDWVHAGDLAPGEMLETKNGFVRVARVGAQALLPVEVFNLEVIGAHQYFVGEHRVRAHNTYASDPVVEGVRAPGKFDATVPSKEEALQAVRTALPDAVEVPEAVEGVPYPKPGPGVKKWYQVQPAEPQVGNDLPHVKYADWTGGKKGTGGSWGHIFFDE
jgi:RHS repeat-associated protein